MTATLLDGKAVAAQFRQALKLQVEQYAKLHGQPSLHVILVGNNPASEIYISAKQRAAAKVGISSHVHRLPLDTSEQDLLALINRLNEDRGVHGILVQLPLPKTINVQTVTDAISPVKDVDGFHPLNIGNMQVGNEALLSCTPHGIIHLLKSYQINLQGKNAVVVGHSQHVGRPLATLLLNENATVSVCHAFTRNLADMTRMADLLIVAVGKKHLITADMVRAGAVVVDVGINRDENLIYGDCDFESVKEVASFITPVPGGVGPMTIAMLLSNTLKAARKQQGELLVV